MEQVEKLLKSDDRITAALAAAATEDGTKISSSIAKQIRRQSTVTFSDVVVENGNDRRVELIPEEDGPESPPASPKGRVKRPITRIPTEIKLKTITHKVKRPAVDIEFHDLVYTVKTASGSKTLLKSISGSFESGKLTAIMGPSGAGKTTLMNILIGYVTNGVGGSILTNGHPRKLHLFNKLSSYIMQEDLLRPNLTVFESMLVAAHLKLGDELSREDKINAVNEIIDCMGLNVCKNTRTNGLSGGQRKRTSIALELVNNPPIVFLDEPTSGLDTVTTTQCLELLKDLARQGRTVVCTLHQPSSTLFHMLDHVYVVANGYCVYQGVPHQLVPFLSSVGLVCKSTYNPADYVLEVINRDTVRMLSQEIQNGKIARHDANNDNDQDYCARRKLCKKETLAVLPAVFENEDQSFEKSLQFATSFGTQFCILYKRKLTQLRRDTTSLWIQFGHHLFSALLLGGIFIGVGNDGSRPFDNFKFCISVLVFFMYTYTMSPVLLFPEEVKLVEREYFNRWYSLKAYYMVTLVTSLPNLLIFGTLFQLIVYFLSDQPMEVTRFVMFCMTGFLSASISEGIGILVGSLCTSATGSIITPMMLVPACVVAVYGMGFGQFVEPFMNFLMSLSYVRYLLVATCVTLYGHRPDMYCGPEHVICLYKDPKLILRDLGMLNKSVVYQLIVLVNFFIFIRVLAYFALRYRLNKEISNKMLIYMKKVLKRKF
ncbi:ATP-binding cassette subfamily G member 4-like [Planococcus citri]|uniref:ATP-binding cassette subfamily G member 4-like n=1 Tax=Planococcus citri TaxID=170843 RepID=UPI0031F8C274